MLLTTEKKDVVGLVNGLNFAEKEERALDLIRDAYHQYGDQLAVANSLGKDSVVVWHLAKRISPNIKGFIVTTQFKPPETKAFMIDSLTRYPELQVFESNEIVSAEFPKKDPDGCCEKLKVEPIRRAIKEMNVGCWVTGLRCTEGRTRTDYQEIEERDRGLVKLNPILTWFEREVWQYIALHHVPVNLLYLKGYRSLGCAPCTSLSLGADERAGRWIGTSKCGGECGIHTRPLKDYQI